LVHQIFVECLYMYLEHLSRVCSFFEQLKKKFF
jgi:hypothetical protein